MTRDKILKDFLKKSVLPIVVFLILFSIFKNYYTIDNKVLKLNIWIYCGIPFGIWQMSSWVNPWKYNGFKRLCATLFTIMFGSVYGSFCMVGKLAMALWYIPLTMFRLAEWKKERRMTTF